MKSKIMMAMMWLAGIVPMTYATDYPNRPTYTDMENAVVKGLACGKAIRERKIAVGSGDSLPYCGTRYAFVTSRQQSLEALTTSYIDHNGPLNTSNTAFLYFTLPSWRELASLNTNGFRRATAWDHNNIPSWSYGIVSNGDVIGPWIFDDLQNGYSVLQWTMRFSYEMENSTVTADGDGGSCEENRQEHDNILASTAWDDSYSTYVYGVDARQELDGGHWQGGRIRGKALISGLPVIPHDYDVYLYPWGHPQGYAFYDFDGKGMQEKVYWLFEESENESEATTHETDVIGDTRANYFSLLGWTCPSPTQVRHQSVFCSGSYWILKWRFTAYN